MLSYIDLAILACDCALDVDREILGKDGLKNSQNLSKLIEYMVENMIVVGRMYDILIYMSIIRRVELELGNISKEENRVTALAEIHEKTLCRLLALTDPSITPAKEELVFAKRYFLTLSEIAYAEERADPQSWKKYCAA